MILGLVIFSLIGGAFTTLQYSGDSTIVAFLFGAVVSFAIGAIYLRAMAVLQLIGLKLEADKINPPDH